MKLRARIEGIGVLGPGLTGWPEAREVLGGGSPLAERATALPAPDLLPPAERRRTGKSIRVSLAAGLEAVAAARRDARDCTAVFASSSGDGDICAGLCEALATDDREISPTRFHNSVHSAPAGYWGIATGSMKAADSLCAFDASFAAGLLEAAARLAVEPGEPVIAIAYDAPYPEPLGSVRPMPEAFAVALVLAQAREGPGVPVAFELTRTESPTILADPRLEAMRLAIPSARSLALLQLLAKGVPGRVVIEYLDGLALAAEVGS
jgi:hypothetical protein